MRGMSSIEQEKSFKISSNYLWRGRAANKIGTFKELDVKVGFLKFYILIAQVDVNTLCLAFIT